MSDAHCTLASNPDISGRGVLIAIYLQNILCFFPAVWALWDGEVTEYELDSVENHSMTNLILAFAILVSCITQALGKRGLSNYHASIILSMSWMNNTNAFIYYLLYVQYKSQDGIEPRWSAWGKHLKGQIEVAVFRPLRVLSRCILLSPWIFARRLFRPHSESQVVQDEKPRASPSGNIAVDAARALFGRIAIALGSFHLTVMSSLGIWLWSAPQSFGTPDTDPECAFKFAKIAVLGLHVPFSSTPLRIISLTMYFIFLIPAINLLLPIVGFMWLHLTHRAMFPRLDDLLPKTAIRPGQSPVEAGTARFQFLRTFRRLQAPLSSLVRAPAFPAYLGLAVLLIIDVVFMMDIELTLRGNQGLRGAEESQWGFGQVLAILLLSMPLRDFVEAVFRRRQEMQTKLDRAFKKAIDDENIPELVKWFRAGADPNVRSERTHRTALEVAALSSNWDLFRELIAGKAEANIQFTDFRTALEVAVEGDQWDLLPSLLEAKADINSQFTDGSGTALHSACQRGPLKAVKFLLEEGADFEIAGARDGQSCLHTACWVGRVDVVRLLLEWGASPNIKDRQGNTALDPACNPGSDHRIVVLLLKYGAKPTPGNTNRTYAFAKSLNVSNIDEAIFVQTAVLGVRSPDDALYVQSLIHLADCHHLRWKTAGSIPDLDEAVRLRREALDHLPPDNFNRIGSLQSLAALLRTQFKQAPSLGTLNEEIRLERELLNLQPVGSKGRSLSIRNLMTSLQHRMELQNSDQDLDAAICLGVEAQERLPPGSEGHRAILGALGALFYRRSQVSGSTEDINRAARLTRDFLSQTIPRRGPDCPLWCSLRRSESASGRSEEAFSHHDMHNGFPLDILEPVNRLATSLERLFTRKGLTSDIGEAIHLRRKLLQLLPHDHAERPNALKSLMNTLNLRSERTGRSEMIDIEEAIHLHGELQRCSPEYAASDESHRDLEIWLHRRSERTGSVFLPLIGPFL